MSLQTLQTAFANASWPVDLNAAFLNANGVSAPSGFDELLIQSFALGSATGLSVGKGDVGGVSDDTFSITGATLTGGLFGAKAADTAVTLVFTLVNTALEVSITTAMPGAWTFATGFPFMVGAAFEQLSFGQTAFIFSTVAGPVTWPAAPSSITLDTGMNFAGTLTLSSAAQTVLKIANIVGADIPDPLVMSGSFDASGVTNETIYPVMSLSAPLSNQQYNFLVFQIAAPFIGFTIEAPGTSLIEGPRKDDDGPAAGQAVASVFGATVVTDTAPPLSLGFTVSLRNANNSITILMAPPADSTPLTPAAIASIAKVPTGFIAYVPAPLQSFFTSVALTGLSATVVQPKSSATPVISSLGVSLATVEGFSLPLINDPSGNFSVTLTALELNWTALNPTGSVTNLVLFTGSFTLLPKIFTNKDGSDGGVFTVSIDQDYTITAAFDGQVTFANLLPAITGGLLQLPSGIAITFEDIGVYISPSTKSYSFSMTVDAEINIITWNGKPLIQVQGMQLALGATTPATAGAVTTYNASLAGLLVVGPISLRMAIAYDGSAATPVWNLSTELAAPLDFGTLLSDIFGVSDPDTYLPNFLPKTLIVQSFFVTAVIPTGTGASKYSIGGSLDWSTNVLPGLDVACTADLLLAYDGSQPAGQQFSGAALGTIAVNQIQGLTLTIGYQFNQPGTNGAGSVLTVQWEGVTGTYNVSEESLTLTLNGWSLGSLVTKLVALAGDPYFSLSAPWDVLNSISLDGFSLTFNMKAGAATTVSASYTLSSPINLGFININGINFARDPKTGKVLLSINGSSPLSSDPAWQSLFSNDPTKGQDVQNMPAPPGQGNALFDLRLLALGQHVAINAANMSSTQQVIQSLEKIPSTEGAASNPVNPNNSTALQPYYSAQSNWLIAADLGLLGFRATDKDPYTYAIEIMIVFNDPNLYGLRLALSGDKVKVLDGLSIDIMYKKVTETVGVYQLEFQFPKALRQLTFGAVNITLPTIGIEIYTNGDFMIDFGFPYNMDFSSSFTIQALIGPIPAMGSGGFYFGKLSNATATNIPQTTKGTFDPVIEFGLGLQVGIGYSIDKGILSAGFSVTFFGIITGVIAPWHPYQGISTGSDVQSDNYFLITGQFGIQGRLYGSINFAIISASVNVLVQLVAQISYESFRAIPLSISASVSVSVSVKIDLGLFSFSIDFSFSATISENMTIGQNETAPWDDDGRMLSALNTPRRRLGGQHHVLVARNIRPVLAFSPFPRVENTTLPEITIVLTPQYTVLVPDVTQPSLAAQQGAFVALFSMDAPSAASTGNATGSSFATLCSLLLPWIISWHPDTAPAALGARAMDDVPISATTLQQIINTLADPNQQPALPAAAILDFLSSSFTVNVVTQPTAAQQTALQNGAALFPATPGLLLTIPDPNNAGSTVTIDFANWSQVTPDYRTAMITAFNNVAATLDFTNNLTPSSPINASGTTPEALAQVVFEDAFAMIGRQLLQAAIDAYDSFPYALQVNDSLQSIMNYAQGETLQNPGFSYQDLILGNLQVPLGGGNLLFFPGITYAVQSTDTLNIIAGRYSDTASPVKYTTTAAGLITANQTATNILQAGVPISTTTTTPGDSFDAILGRLNINIDALAALIADTAGLLLPAVSIAIPAIAYTTVAAGTDTFGALLPLFGVTADNFVAISDNLIVPNIFTGTLVYLSNLEALTGTQLAAAVSAGESIGQTAGMVSRFMMHGLRMPNNAGVSLPPGFLYPAANQPDYGLYQLTGQQFPVTAYTGDYTVTLAKNSALSWMLINGSSTAPSGTLDLTQSVANLNTVLNWATTSGYNPNAANVTPPLTLEVEPAVTLTPQAFAAAGFAPWTTSGMAEIAAVTAPAASAAAMLRAAVTDTQGSGQVQPVLWQLPTSLLSQIETQQAALMNDMTLAEAISYLPVLAPVTLTTDPSTQAATKAAVSQFSLATRIDFRIQRLSQAAGAQTQTAGGNTLFPAGSGNAPPVTELAPNAYQLIGPNPSDALLLERSLVQLEELGAKMITGVLVGYATAAGAQAGLTGHASGDVFSFITRSNLSTQANPPAMTAALFSELGVEPDPVNNFQNQPQDFLRLMWELTTVQSGGYTFYWDGAASGAVLPPGLFDADGFATLTLLITWARAGQLAPGARVTDCCNAVLTADAIDTTRATLVLESQSAPATTTPLAGDTVALLAARYGMTPGTLAQANPGVPLTASAQFTLNAGYHQVSLADVASGDILGTIAAYYSLNAVQPITAAQLQTYNPNVTPALYAVLMIPPITYVTSKTDTFGGIAAYFGPPIEEIGFMAQSVAGLIATTQTINVNPQAFSAVTALGTGNLGVKIGRANLGTPDLQNDPANYPQDYMFSMYSLLDAAYEANAFFSASTPTSPFGPTAAGAGQSGLVSSHAETLIALRHPQTRRALLAALAENPVLNYEQALNAMISAGTNAAPAKPAANLPPASANPYIGVGTIAQLRLRWLDVFGNQTSTPFNAPPVGYTGPLNNPPIPLSYTDTLIGPSQWPNVSTYYQYTGPAGAPVLSISLALNIAPYALANNAPAQAAIEDAKLFNQVYFQLNQNYDGLNIPGLAGPAVTASLLNTLTGGVMQPLDTTNSAALVQFVNDCAAYVNAAAAGAPPATAPTGTLSLSVPLTSVVADNIVRLRVMLMLSRQATLVAPELLDVPGGISVQAEIPAYTYTQVTDKSGLLALEAPPPPDALTPFAKSMETAFVASGWNIRVGAGPQDPDEPTAGQSHTVWAVRFSVGDSGQGLDFTLGSQPVFFAPKPVAQALITGQVTLPVYTTGTGLSAGSSTTNFTGADLNLWLAQAMNSIDNFLSPGYATPTYILDILSGSNPDENGLLAGILAQKSLIATTVGDTVTPIFASDAPSAVMSAAAQTAMEQSALQLLANATAVTAVAVVPVSDATTNEPLPPGVASAPAFYGQPVDTTDQATGNTLRNYALSAGSIPLNAKGVADTDSTLAFLFTCANPSLQTIVPLTLSYQVTHVRNDITAVPGITGYQQSTWIAFVTGPLNYEISSTAIDFPVVLRALPPPPTAQAQTATASADGTTPAKLPNWDYAFTFSANWAAQDQLIATVAFNTSDPQLGATPSPADVLFQNLAALFTLTPAIFADFDAWLRKVNNATKTTDTAYINAKAAVGAFSTLVTNVATAYAGWANPAPVAAALPGAVSGPPPVTLEFTVTLINVAGAAAIEVTSVGSPPTGAPVPVVLLDPAVYTPVPFTPSQPPPNLIAAYQYVAADKSLLSYNTATLINARSITFQDLNGLAYQKAETEIEILRNQDLDPGSNRLTADAFVFATPPVAFATPTVPLIVRASFDLSTVGNAPPLPLANYLDEFFTQLLGANGAQWVTTQIQSSGSYAISSIADGPRISVPINLMLPTAPTPAAINAMAVAVSGWLTQNGQYLTGPNALLDFEIILYSTLPGDVRPLLKIENAFVAIDKLP